ncbi:MAG: T9SS type A sorting domain-containing protein [Flavobacteriales bacterium]|nr:T9SS type A sorting domain-containing protein [Flavobacteriales bacterium]MBK6945666.1 T9SS type A sorting domain-containing protein [Flavobacteriales bacterium]MBK7241770.1 T9SS type A sorting domain-containing protein [Flavobacteriales bacterium]MBK7296227.1 T9SS type A sorting domain-containing protein [Flavobacteriales bacterium]MBP9137746.1 T9SS type A sorting domain-containing protein [Flavobacteriales bacterium]
MSILKATFASCILSILSLHQAVAQFVVPDAALVTKLQFFVPAAMNGNVLDTTHADVLNLAVLPICCAGITDLSGVEYFTGLVELRANNNAITTLNELPPNLEILNLRINNLTSLPTLPNTLEDLDCSVNVITGLPDLPQSLIELDCTSNQINSLPALPSTLDALYCGINPLFQLPTLPPALRRLGCVATSLTALPTLPPMIWTIDCSGNQLSVFPAIPASLQYLSCSQNNLSVLPTLPTGMESLDCRSNPSLVLPSLPPALNVFWCDAININTLPPLPNTIISLSCGDLNLTALPTLPDSLQYFNCANNQLTTLPTLPNSLDRFHCDNNALGSLPALPSSLTWFTCSNNTLACLPTLPNGLANLNTTGNNLNCLPNIPLAYDPVLSELGFPLVVCDVVTGPCAILQEAITGTVFNDENGNGSLDAGEAPFLNATVEATPGNYLTAPDANGNYVLPMDVGTFTLDGQDVLYHTRTTAATTITLAALQIDSLNDIGYQAIPGVHDLVVQFHTAQARPGFSNNLYLNVKNIGTESTTADVTLTFDADQNWGTSTVAPATLNATDASWSLMMMPGDEWDAIVTLNTPVGTALGTPLDHLFSALPAAADTTPADNSVAFAGMVVGSFDPNDKTASPATLTPEQVQNGAYIEYTIRFQNTGNYPAERVVITDTLSSDLQWHTMEYVSGSHTNTWYMNEGLLVFVFDPIFLPDSVSDEPNSHGFVTFKVKPESNLQDGAQIENIANIYFDFNEPVITEPCVFSVDVNTGIATTETDGFSIYPNPASQEVNVFLDEPNAMFTLHALDGRLLQSEGISSDRTTLDISGLVAGMYLINITKMNGERVAHRFVKN